MARRRPLATLHDRDFHLFDAGVVSLPNRHLVAQISLNLLGHFLEEGAGGAAASGTSGNLRSKVADAERLQNLLRHTNFFRAIPTRSGSQRDANRVANAFL